MLINIPTLFFKGISLVSSLFILGYILFYYFRLKYHWFPRNPAQITFSKRMLFINFDSEKNDDTVSFLNITLTFLNKGNKVVGFLKTGSWLERQFQVHHIPYYHCVSLLWVGEFYIEKIVKKESINLIHCSHINELAATQKISKNNFVRLIIAKSSFSNCDLSLIQNLDGIVHLHFCSDPEARPQLASENSLTQIEVLPPFCNHERLLAFTPPLEKAYDYFRHFFGAHQQAPYLVIVDSNETAIHTIFQGARLFKRTHKVQCNLIFLDESNNDYLHEYAHHVGIEEMIHTLPRDHNLILTLAQSNGIISCNNETLPLVALEAAFLKKPLIVPLSLNEKLSIINPKTALFYDIPNPATLIYALKILSENSTTLTTTETLYSHMVEEFSPDTLQTRLDSFYTRILKRSGTFL